MAAINKINLDDTTYDLNDARLADFIVEQGTNNGWTYRKYNSGVMEAWCKMTGTSTGATSSVNLTKTFPDGMKAAATVNVNVGSTGSVGAECHYTGFSGTGVDVWAYPTSKSGTSVWAYVHLMGTWK